MYNYNVVLKPFRNVGKTVVNKIVQSLPAVEFKKGAALDTIKWAGQHISSPQNRLILGVTALMSQPFIDLHNRNVDENTRKVSAARTVAKIIAGTTTGFLVRYYTIKAVDAFTKKPDFGVKEYESLLYPRNLARVTLKGLKQHKFAIGTFLSLGIMLFTNFAIDAPLTKFLTNKFIKNLDLNNTQKPGSETPQNPTPSANPPFFKRPSMGNFNNIKEADNVQS